MTGEGRGGGPALLHPPLARRLLADALVLLVRPARRAVPACMESYFVTDWICRHDSFEPTDLGLRHSTASLSLLVSLGRWKISAAASFTASSGIGTRGEDEDDEEVALALAGTDLSLPLIFS